MLGRCFLTLECVDMPFSRGSSQTKVRTQVSHIAGGFFTIWAIREARLKISTELSHHTQFWCLN